MQNLMVQKAIPDPFCSVISVFLSINQKTFHFPFIFFPKYLAGSWISSTFASAFAQEGCERLRKSSLKGLHKTEK